MTSGDLTSEQAQKMYDTIVPTLGYLNRVLKRMQLKGFPDEDNLWQRTLAARNEPLAAITELGSVIGHAKRRESQPKEQVEPPF